MQTAYLFACGLGAVIWTACFLMRPDLRRIMLGMSVIGVPLAFSDLFYVPHYWRPRTLGHIPIGIEGFIFSFEAAGICAVIYALASGRGINGQDADRPFSLRRLLSPRTLIAILPLPISSIAIRVCPRLPPTIEERIADTRAANVADSVMYRQALASAAEARGWSRRDPTAWLAGPRTETCAPL